MTPHLLCCQGFAVINYSFTLDALDLQHPRLLQGQGTLRSKLAHMQFLVLIDPYGTKGQYDNLGTFVKKTQ
jgi:hypothetical protein